jgi:hypothetical protein
MKLDDVYFCDFCGRHMDYVEDMIFSHINGTAICSSCTEECDKIFERKRAEWQREKNEEEEGNEMATD